ncbi:hypothetical protein TNCT_528121 [Trichonephila clavata]|uniref:Uncharacterized protein n=1 Tax=Trichonephila clavata TaxID=2740835 RepID=A0A8X6LG22_TRICU|nr:hypothetical protein TNCT_528121 [Trichonephila clavata]
MSSRVANRLLRIDSLILGMRSKSQVKCQGEYGGCFNSSHPQRWSSCRTHSALWGVALSCRIIALSPISESLFLTPRHTYRTRKSL